MFFTFATLKMKICLMQLQPVKGTKVLYITCEDSAQKELIFPLAINYPVKLFMPLSHLVGISRNQAEPAGIKVRARFWWEFQISKNAARLLRTNLE